MHLLREKLGQTAVENPNEERRHEAHLISLSHCHVRLAIEALNESIVLRIILYADKNCKMNVFHVPWLIVVQKERSNFFSAHL